jgi:hypothetical protein
MNLAVREQEALEARAEMALDGLRSLSPLTILQKFLYHWRPQDARLDESYCETHNVTQSDNPIMVHLAEGMELSIIQKLPRENSLIVGVFFPSNTAEYERYYSVLGRASAEWERNNSPEDVFDPVSGDLHEVDPFVGVKAPKPSRALYARLRLSLDIRPESFVLSFAAWDLQDRVLFYDVLESESVSYLMRRAMHELFGNHLLRGDSGPFLEGISYLIQGKKLKLCRNHPKPSWLDDSNYKTVNVDLIQYQAEATLLKTVAFVLRYLVPVGLFIYGVFVNTIHSLMLFDKTDVGDPLYIHKLIGSLAFAVISFKISQAIDRYVSVLNHKSKLT